MATAKGGFCSAGADAFSHFLKQTNLIIFLSYNFEIESLKAQIRLHFTIWAFKAASGSLRGL